MRARWDNGYIGGSLLGDNVFEQSVQKFGPIFDGRIRVRSKLNDEGGWMIRLKVYEMSKGNEERSKKYLGKCVKQVIEIY